MVAMHPAPYCTRNEGITPTRTLALPSALVSRGQLAHEPGGDRATETFGGSRPRNASWWEARVVISAIRGRTAEIPFYSLRAGPPTSRELAAETSGLRSKAVIRWRDLRL